MTTVRESTRDLPRLFESFASGLADQGLPTGAEVAVRHGGTVTAAASSGLEPAFGSSSAYTRSSEKTPSTEGS